MRRTAYFECGGAKDLDAFETPPEECPKCGAERIDIKRHAL